MSRTAGRSLVRVAGLALLPVAALIAAWWFTRGPASAPVPPPDAHDHAAMRMEPADGSGAVTLTPAQARRIGVTFAEAVRGPLATAVLAAGQVTVDESRVRAVTLRYDGWVERLRVDRTGQAVRAGEPLLELYAPMVVGAQEELLLARRLAADLRDADPRARADAEALLEAARLRLARWEVPDEVIEAVERSGTVARTVTPRAPASGVVLDKPVTAGQRVMAGEVLYRLADLSTVWVEAEVYEQDLRSVAVGRPASAEFDALPGERWQGRIRSVSPTLALDTRTARVRVELANPGSRLKPGMLATLRIAGTPIAQAVTVPRSAVLETGERALVFVRDAEGRLVPREVVVGGTNGERTAILRGLAAGEVVVTSATFLVDAESNLRTALGGMGDMPGMDVVTPPAAKRR